MAKNNPTTAETPKSTNSTESSLFIAPCGKWWSAGHNAHTPTAQAILEAVGFDGMIGTIYLIDSGEWIQELRNGQMVPMTPAQREVVEMAANFPECGVKTAAIKALRHFDTIANEQARHEQSERQLAAIRYIVSLENEAVRS
jgi:hypothetical protein